LIFTVCTYTWKRIWNRWI